MKNKEFHKAGFTLLIATVIGAGAAFTLVNGLKESNLGVAYAQLNLHGVNQEGVDACIEKATEFTQGADGRFAVKVSKSKLAKCGV